jgi:hypothetical protein
LSQCSGLMPVEATLKSIYEINSSLLKEGINLAGPS